MEIPTCVCGVGVEGVSNYWHFSNLPALSLIKLCDQVLGGRNADLGMYRKGGCNGTSNC